MAGSHKLDHDQVIHKHFTGLFDPAAPVPAINPQQLHQQLSRLPTYLTPDKKSWGLALLTAVGFMLLGWRALSASGSIIPTAVALSHGHAILLFAFLSMFALAAFAMTFTVWVAFTKKRRYTQAKSRQQTEYQTFLADLAELEQLQAAHPESPPLSVHQLVTVLQLKRWLRLQHHLAEAKLAGRQIDPNHYQIDADDPVFNGKPIFQALCRQVYPAHQFKVRGFKQAKLNPQQISAQGLAMRAVLIAWRDHKLNGVNSKDTIDRAMQASGLGNTDKNLRSPIAVRYRFFVGLMAMLNEQLQTLRGCELYDSVRQQMIEQLDQSIKSLYPSKAEKRLARMGRYFGNTIAWGRNFFLAGIFGGGVGVTGVVSTYLTTLGAHFTITGVLHWVLVTGFALAGGLFAAIFIKPTLEKNIRTLAEGNWRHTNWRQKIGTAIGLIGAFGVGMMSYVGILNMTEAVGVAHALALAVAAFIAVVTFMAFSLFFSNHARAFMQRLERTRHQRVVVDADNQLVSPAKLSVWQSAGRAAMYVLFLPFVVFESGQTIYYLAFAPGSFFEALPQGWTLLLASIVTLCTLIVVVELVVKTVETLRLMGGWRTRAVPILALANPGAKPAAMLKPTVVAPPAQPDDPPSAGAESGLSPNSGAE